MSPECTINTVKGFRSSNELHVAITTKPQCEVKHGFLKWSIENFSSFPHTNDVYIVSPIFITGKTWWNMALHPKAKICGQNKISLNLFRHKSDLGPETVNVSYRIGLECGENKVWFKPVEDASFKKGCSYGFQTSVLEHLEDFVGKTVDNINDTTLSVLCELYVKYSTIVNVSLNSRTSHIDPELCFDMITLLESENNYDILIEIPKLVRFRAHKCVLSARSKTLARMLEDGKSFIQFSCSSSCFNCVLLYMYSGNFDYFLENSVFSIGLFELACELGLHKLIDYLIPFKIDLKSRIEVEDCTILHPLDQLMMTNCIPEKMENEVHFNKKSGVGITIRLQKTDNSEYLEFVIKVCGILAALDFSLKLQILNKNLNTYEMISETSLHKSDAVFENLNFTYTVRVSAFDILKFYKSDGYDHLVFECKRYSLMHSSVAHNASKELPIPCDSSNWCLEDLSLDLKELLKGGYLSDVTLLTYGQAFKAHRSILGARSPAFRKLFQYNQHKNGVLPVYQFDPHTIELLLDYIYSGTFSYNSVFNKVDILELYEAGEEFAVYSFKQNYCNLLILSLDSKFVFEVLKSAERYGNSYLIDKCKYYITKYNVVEEVYSEETMEDEYLE